MSLQLATQKQIEFNTTKSSVLFKKDVCGIRPGLTYIPASQILMNAAENRRNQATVEETALRISESIWKSGVQTPLGVFCIDRLGNKERTEPIDFRVQVGFSRLTAVLSLKKEILAGNQPFEGQPCGWDEDIKDFWVPVTQFSETDQEANLVAQLISNSGAELSAADKISITANLSNTIDPKTDQPYKSKGISELFVSSGYSEATDSRVRQWLVISRIPFLDSVLANTAIPNTESVLAEIGRGIATLSKFAAGEIFPEHDNAGEDFTGKYMSSIVATLEALHEAETKITAAKVKTATEGFLRSVGAMEVKEKTNGEILNTEEESEEGLGEAPEAKVKPKKAEEVFGEFLAALAGKYADSGKEVQVGLIAGFLSRNLKAFPSVETAMERFENEVL